MELKYLGAVRVTGSRFLFYGAGEAFRVSLQDGQPVAASVYYPPYLGGRYFFVDDKKC